MQEAELLRQLLEPKPATPHPLPAPGRSMNSRKKGGKGKRGEVEFRKGAVDRPLGPERERKVTIECNIGLKITLGIIEKQSLNAILGCDIKPNFLFKIYL